MELIIELPLFFFRNVKMMDMERMKFKINIMIPLLLFLIISLAGCSGVKSEMDKSADLGTFKTYSLKAPDVKTDNPLYKSDLIDNSIKQSIETELAQKGMIRNDQDPDIYVLYHTYTQTMQQTGGALYEYPVGTPPGYVNPGYSTTYGPMYSGGLGGYNNANGAYGAYSYSYGLGYPNYYPSPYLSTQETLIIDFIDAKTNKVVWSGSINSDATDVSRIDKALTKDVHAILKKYSENSEGKMVQHHVKTGKQHI